MAILEIILFAFGAGLVYGIFGGGSGLLLMPGYYLVMRHFSDYSDYTMQMAITTTAISTAVLALPAVRMQISNRAVDASIIKKIFKGVLVGSMVAIVLLNIMPSELLKKMFGCIVILVAFWFLLYRQDKDLNRWSLVGVKNHAITFTIGLLWFLLGIAVFTVPYLVKCGTDIRKAVGTGTLLSALFSAIVGIILALTGVFHIGISANHFGFLSIPLFLLTIIPSSIAAFIGAKVSLILPKNILKISYSGLLVVIGILML